MTLREYAESLVNSFGKALVSGEVFAKVLTSNDDASRHGVHIPNDAYSFFPIFNVIDPTQNQTLEFDAFNAVERKPKCLAYKYYERYPERRITRLPPALNRDATDSVRLIVVIRGVLSDNTVGYFYDCTNTRFEDRFGLLYPLLFGIEVSTSPGRFIVRPIDDGTFAADAVLSNLLGKFDEVKAMGWIDSKRTGDTGVGYTFESLIGIKENNDQKADFSGIEIKCKGLREGEIVGSGKLNLFQAGPKWMRKSSNRERIRLFGAMGDDGLYSCYSQVTTAPNNRDLLCDISEIERRVFLLRKTDRMGYWTFEKLSKRLEEKHARAAFIKARKRSNGADIQYSYEELVYCERPSIERFLDLVQNHNIVFEFLMSEKASGAIRNHGYPWRLARSELLNQLFAFQLRLRWAT